jgi:hypothetical protein
MASISISDPTPNSTVSQTFPASGGYTTGPGLFSAGDDGNEVKCTLYDSNQQVIQVQVYYIVGHTPPPSGTWEVEFAVDQNYSGCSITAELILANVPPPPPSASVDGITISS